MDPNTGLPQDEDPNQGFPQDDINAGLGQEATPPNGQEPNSQDVHWEKRFKDTQSSYTKLQQKIQTIENAFVPQDQAPQLSEEQIAVTDQLKDLGFADMQAVKDLVTGTVGEMKNESDLREIISSNPSLAPYTKAIRTIHANDPSVPLEAIISDNFMNGEKLAAAGSQSGLNGSSIPEDPNARKSISDMNDDEYRAMLDANSKKKFVRRM